MDSKPSCTHFFSSYTFDVWNYQAYFEKNKDEVYMHTYKQYSYISSHKEIRKTYNDPLIWKQLLLWKQATAY